MKSKKDKNCTCKRYDSTIHCPVHNPRKTYKDAAKALPEKAQQPFMELWELAESGDLYDGDLALYLQVIMQRYKQTKKEKALLQGTAIDIANTITETLYIMKQNG